MNQPKNEPVVIIVRIKAHHAIWGEMRSADINSDGTLKCKSVELEPVVPRED